MPKAPVPLIGDLWTFGNPEGPPVIIVENQLNLRFRTLHSNGDRGVVEGLSGKLLHRHRSVARCDLGCRGRKCGKPMTVLVQTQNGWAQVCPAHAPMTCHLLYLPTNVQNPTWARFTYEPTYCKPCSVPRVPYEYSFRSRVANCLVCPICRIVFSAPRNPTHPSFLEPIALPIKTSEPFRVPELEPDPACQALTALEYAVKWAQTENQDVVKKANHGF